ncbi:unnamed protein product [Periconia digitata]|uniref:Uncharacterized protein n=1 Tax=Periconia digitata TaxID=1303443 RepID=A0A9W4UT59_9PLEO|nr:unnamed protein product [Periconia digitata]
MPMPCAVRTHQDKPALWEMVCFDQQRIHAHDSAKQLSHQADCQARGDPYRTALELWSRLSMSESTLHLSTNGRCFTPFCFDSQTQSPVSPKFALHVALLSPLRTHMSTCCALTPFLLDVSLALASSFLSARG